MQCLGDLCLSWYSLREGDRGYHPLEVGLTLGPDLACDLRPLWATIREYAEQLEKLCQQCRSPRGKPLRRARLLEDASNLSSFEPPAQLGACCSDNRETRQRPGSSI